MKIDVDPNKQGIHFSELEIGDTFRYKEVFYMKVTQSKIGSTKLDAVQLNSGALVIFNNDSEVEIFPLKAVRDES